ncbi:MAG: pyridoxamine 5'-phosphate oxidase family protein [Bacteroidota bacterium]
MPERGSYDSETIFPILDEALICNVGFVDNGRAIVIPTILARDGDKILLHGSHGSRMMNHVAAGNQLCITVTHLDGLVLARSSMHHSMNYRSAVVYGTGKIIDDPETKMRALGIFTDKLIPGRWDDARKPNPAEERATMICEVEIESASAKIRTGPPGDDDEDYALDVWAGILPMRQVFGDLIEDPLLKDGVGVPQYLKDYKNSKQ